MRRLVLGLVFVGGTAAAQTPPAPGRLSNDGVVRAASQVDSVFVDRTKQSALIDGGDWASYLLARLGAGPIPDRLGIAIGIDSTHLAVSGRLADLPPETRALLGPLASQIDPNTVIIASVIVQRTGPEVVRFWLRSLTVNGFPFPEFLMAPMMASVGRHYPALTRSGRDLYVQVPPDGRFALSEGGVVIAVPGLAADSAATPRPPKSRP